MNLITRKTKWPTVAALGVSVVALTILIGSSEARAETCRFTSTALVFDNNLTGLPITFTWNNTPNISGAGDVIYDSSTCNSSNTDYYNTLCGVASSPGHMEPDFAITGQEPHKFELHFVDGDYTLTMVGLLSGHSGYTTESLHAVSFAAVTWESLYYNSFSIDGQGTVACW